MPTHLPTHLLTKSLTLTLTHHLLVLATIVSGTGINIKSGNQNVGVKIK
jgi:hypothetical protein